MKETLTKKLGPLPTWAWAVIAAIGVGAFLLWRKSQSTASTNPSSSTGSSTLPAGSGVAVVGSGGDGWQGYNNPGPGASTQGPGSTVGTAPATPGFIPLLTVGDVMQAAAEGLTIFEQSSSGVFKPTSYTTKTLTGFAKYPATALISETGAVPLFASSPQAASVQAAPGVTMQPQALNATGGNLNSSNPASAIAPSALQPV